MLVSVQIFERPEGSRKFFFIIWDGPSICKTCGLSAGQPLKAGRVLRGFSQIPTNDSREAPGQSER